MEIVTKEEWHLLFDTMNAYVNTQALATACDFNLFTILSDKHGLTANEIQKELNISSYATRVLLLCCCNTKLIVRDPKTKKYYNSSAAQKMLNSNLDYSMLDFINFNELIQKPTLAYFTQSLQNNDNSGLKVFPGNGDTLYERLTEYPELEGIFQKALSAYSKWLSPKLLDVEEFTEIRNLLELAGGDATNAISLCKKFLNLNITILEKPSVCSYANKKISKEALNSRIKCLEADVFEDLWPKNSEAIFISHFIEIFHPEKIQLLYKKIYDYLPEEGKFIFWAAMSDDLETGNLQSSKSSMYFLTTASGGGMTYPLVDHLTWLNDAGFKIIKYTVATEIEHTVVIATK